MEGIQFAYYMTKAWIQNNWNRINEHAFTTIMLLIATGMMFHSYSGTVEAYRVISLIVLKVALFLNISDLYVKFLGSLGRDLNKEIFDDNNVASAQYISGFRIALAIVLLSVI